MLSQLGMQVDLSLLVSARLPIKEKGFYQTHCPFSVIVRAETEKGFTLECYLQSI